MSIEHSVTMLDIAGIGPVECHVLVARKPKRRTVGRDWRAFYWALRTVGMTLVGRWSANVATYNLTDCPT